MITQRVDGVNQTGHERWRRDGAPHAAPIAARQEAVTACARPNNEAPRPDGRCAAPLCLDACSSADPLRRRRWWQPCGSGSCRHVATCRWPAHSGTTPAAGDAFDAPCGAFAVAPRHAAARCGWLGIDGPGSVRSGPVVGVRVPRPGRTMARVWHAPLATGRTPAMEL